MSACRPDEYGTTNRPRTGRKRGGMKRYVGTRTANGCTVEVIDQEGWREPLDPRFDLRRHSPDGYSWGYSGSGPSQLSLALLADALGDDARAQAAYMDFKFQVVGRIAGDSFELTEDDIRATVARLEAERGQGRA